MCCITQGVYGLNMTNVNKSIWSYLYLYSVFQRKLMSWLTSFITLISFLLIA
jgi:hypothetical protein